MAPIARFDDLVARHGLRFGTAHGELMALCPAEVPEVLAEAERAASAGSWACGFVSYEAATGLDPGLVTRSLRPGDPFASLPLAWFGLFGTAEEVPPLAPTGGAGRGCGVTEWVADTAYPLYAQRVAAVREAIAAGETYQCNLTVRLRARVSGDLESLYRDLALAQGGAHCAFLDTGRFVVVSASPELFFEWREGRIAVRPMKGTAPRGRWSAEDATRARALVASEKDRAENLMIVDLMRNDLGRIAVVGSVRVPALFELERYETVWQLTSSVAATPQPGTSLVDVFRALFPCGSVTGAPKRRTMEIIAELEDAPRGVYCGAVGVVAPPGASFRARFSVAIRTVVVDRESGTAVYGTGGGVTWDSDPAGEHAELLAKAAILTHKTPEFRLLETMAFVPGEGVRNLGRHLDRLATSARYFGFPVDEVRLGAVVSEVTAPLTEPRRIRLLLDRDGDVSCGATPMPPRGVGPVRLAVDPEPVSSTDVWLYHKTTRRTPYVERASRHRQADDVVLVNERSHPTETTRANLVVRIDGRWWTPPLEVGCLPGVERGRLVDEGVVSERILTLEDLFTANEVAVVSSLRGWLPAALSSDIVAAAGLSRGGVVEGAMRSVSGGSRQRPPEEFVEERNREGGVTVGGAVDHALGDQL